jgi:hypothetical protein
MKIPHVTLVSALHGNNEPCTPFRLFVIIIFSEQQTSMLFGNEFKFESPQHSVNFPAKIMKETINFTKQNLA